MNARASIWGEQPIERVEATRFAETLPVSGIDREQVVDTLARFPVACQVRGMFFDGLANVITKAQGEATTKRLLEEVGAPARRAAFGLYAHRDFYKLYFAAAPVLHRGAPLPVAMQRIAETFYPVFRESMVGRTMATLMGNAPRRVLGRLADAYSMSVPWNEHEMIPRAEADVIWRCKVEPSAFYEYTLRGIVTGTLESHGAAAPHVTLLKREDQEDASRFEFRIRW